MSWSARRPFLARIACGFVAGASAVTGVAWIHGNGLPLQSQTATSEISSSVNSSPLGKVLASWTTNFKPSVEWDSNWDRRDPAVLVKPSKLDKEEKDKENIELKKATPTVTRHLFFIRHGQYNLDGDGDKNRFLTALGRDQATFTGARLKELDHPYTKMVNSTMTRARETADIIADYLPKDIERTSCDMLREGAPIPPEPSVGHWRPENHKIVWNVNNLLNNTFCPQQFFEDGARIEAAFRRYFHRASPKQEKDSYEVFVCHANVIRYFVCRALQLPPEAWLRMSLHNASITWFTLRPSGRVSVKTVGDCGHIPKDKLTTS